MLNFDPMTGNQITTATALFLRSSRFTIAWVAMFCLILSGCYDTPGCTDLNALNYNADAETDDGSCEYDPGLVTQYLEYTSGGVDYTQVTDLGMGTGTMTWTKDRVWLLNGNVFVNNEQALTIEPGTVVQGRTGNGNLTGALIVAQGGNIHACGTAAEPIIFTAEGDDLNGSVGDMEKGLWGGLVLLGSAPINVSGGTATIDGLDTTAQRTSYGGSENASYSGALCYLSIRHAGADPGTGPMSGLTLGGVGFFTVIHHIEVISSAGDGVRFLGGTVDVKHLISSFCDQDGISTNEGYRGKGQFWTVVQDGINGGHAANHQGGSNPIAGTPISSPEIWNATYVGNGNGQGQAAVSWSDNSAGNYSNGMIANWQQGLVLERRSSGSDSYQQHTDGQIKLDRNMFYAIAQPGTAASVSDLAAISNPDGISDISTEQSQWQGHFTSHFNVQTDAGLSFNISTAGGLNLVPTFPISPGSTPTDGWFDAVNYRGAFDPFGSNWAHGWTMLHLNGYLD